MREDILKKKREKMKEGGGDIKVEIVGLPDFMVVEETTNRPPNNLKEIKQKYKIDKAQSQQDNQQMDGFVVMAGPPRRQWAGV